MNDDGDWDPVPIPLDETLDDDVFRALSDARRRYVLYFLLEHDTASLEELADVVAGWSRAARPGMTLRAERNRIRTALHHHHVPQLEAAGIVSYDASRGTVSMADTQEAVLDLVRWAAKYERDTVRR